MRFMALVKADKNSEAGVLPSKELVAAMGKFNEEMIDAGVLLAAEGLQAMRSHPHVLMFPAIAICLTMFCFQAFGEGLRRALDPREAELD